MNRVQVQIIVYQNDRAYTYEHLAENEVSVTAPLASLEMLEMGEMLGNLWVDTIRQAIRKEKKGETEAS